MILAGTGHRPEKLGGYDEDNFLLLSRFVHDEVYEIAPSKIITGMALGFDLAFAVAAIKLEIPFIAACPCKEQDKMWPEKSQKLYRAILAKASEVVYINEEYRPWVMQKRNEWMVDHCDNLLALYNKTKGGTHNCVKYAESKKKNIINIWDNWNAFLHK